MKFDGYSTCRCFECWTGDTCGTRIPTLSPNCVVDSNGGSPYMFESYWVDHPEPALTVLPSYHLGYGSRVPRLEGAIRELHALVGNAVTDGKHIVIGVGSTELISAAMYALSESIREGTGTDAEAAVWSAAPFYSGYVSPARFFHTRDFAWLESDTTPVASGARPVLELITSPNNPDGHLRAPQVSASPYRRVLMDHAYLWPHFTAITSPVDYANDTIALFTLSKMTGHASTRIGWAIVSDARVARRMEEWMITATLGVPRENQLRALATLEHVNAHHAEILDHARGLMLGRWARLEAIFANQRPAVFGSTPADGPPLFRLEPRDASTADTWSGARAYAPSPAYAWIEMGASDGHARTDRYYNGSALAAMASVGITARPGTLFGASRRFVRLQLLMREQTFSIMCEKLEALLSTGSPTYPYLSVSSGTRDANATQA